MFRGGSFPLSPPLDETLHACTSCELDICIVNDNYDIITCACAVCYANVIVPWQYMRMHTALLGEM